MGMNMRLTRNTSRKQIQTERQLGNVERVQQRRVHERLVLALLAEEPQFLDLRADHAVVLELQHATQRVLLLTSSTHPHVSIHVRLLDLRERFLRLISFHRLTFPSSRSHWKAS